MKLTCADRMLRVMFCFPDCSADLVHLLPVSAWRRPGETVQRDCCCAGAKRLTQSPKHWKAQVGNSVAITPITELRGVILESLRACVRLSGFCPEDMSWTAQLFVTKLGMVVYYREEWHAKNSFAIFKVKVTARAYVIKLWLFWPYLLNFLSICNQTWF